MALAGAWDSGWRGGHEGSSGNGSLERLRIVYTGRERVAMKAPGVAGAGSLGTGGRAEGGRVAALAVVGRPPLRRAARVRGQYRQFPREASAAGGERDDSRGWMPNEEYAGLPAVLDETHETTRRHWHFVPDRR